MWKSLFDWLYDMFFWCMNADIQRESFQSSPLDRWLLRGSSKNEEVLEKDMPIIDPHVHFWDSCKYPTGRLSMYFSRLQVVWHRTTWRPGRRSIRIFYRLLLSMFQWGRGKLNTWGWHPRCMVGFDRYLVEELQDDFGGHNVQQVVGVESGWGPVELEHEEGEHRLWMEPREEQVQEAEFLQGLSSANQKKYPQAIIGYIDFRMGRECDWTFEEMKKRCPGLKGIRHPLAFVGPAVCYVDKRVDSHDMAMDPKFREGFALLEKYELSFDALIYYNNMRQLYSLAKSFPKVTIIVNNCALPLKVGPYDRKYGRVMREWKKGLKLLAECPNVHMKLAGLGMPCCGFKFETRKGGPPGSEELCQHWSPYFKDVIAEFGFDRCMFASNFPYDRVSCSYKVLWNCYKRFCKESGYSAEQKRKLFHENAKRIYRLD